MPNLAIIGGTGLNSIQELEDRYQKVLSTPFGDPSGPLLHGKLNGISVVFLPRHGEGHTIAPHKINYRANLWALREVGIKRILSVAAVGGIGHRLHPGTLVLPDQIIDYTDSRQNTFFEEGVDPVVHVDFTHPYCEELRQGLLKAASDIDIELIANAVYGVTQGPRLETAAEINRMERDGCDVVGMTGMPEAALARELELNYATCAVVANAAAGRGVGVITMNDIQENLQKGMLKVRRLVLEFVNSL